MNDDDLDELRCWYCGTEGVAVHKGVRVGPPQGGQEVELCDLCYTCAVSTGDLMSETARIERVVARYMNGVLKRLGGIDRG